MSSQGLPHRSGTGGAKSITPFWNSQESHKKTIYSVSWCADVYREVVAGSERSVRYFATCARNVASVYKVTEETAAASDRGGGANNSSKFNVDLIQIYEDPTIEEELYTCAWGARSGGFPFSDDEDYNDDEALIDGDGSVDDESIHDESTDASSKKITPPPSSSSSPTPPSSSPSSSRRRRRVASQLLAVAGKGRRINLIDPSSARLISTLSGHGDEIFEIMFVPIGSTSFDSSSSSPSSSKGGIPVDEYLLLSCGKDESIRLWNVRCGTCVIIFAGHRGHRQDILSIDVHPLGHSFVSSGLDTTIKIWNFQESEIVSTNVRASEEQLGIGWLPDNAIHEDGKTKRRLFSTPHVQLPYFSTNKVHYDYVDCVR